MLYVSPDRRKRERADQKRRRFTVPEVGEAAKKPEKKQRKRRKREDIEPPNDFAKLVASVLEGHGLSPANLAALLSERLDTSISRTRINGWLNGARPRQRLHSERAQADQIEAILKELRRANVTPEHGKPPTQSEVVEQIAEWEHLGLSPKQVAMLGEISRSSYNYWRRGEALPSRARWQRARTLIDAGIQVLMQVGGFDEIEEFRERITLRENYRQLDAAMKRIEDREAGGGHDDESVE